MSRGQDFHGFNAGARELLKVDLGPVDDTSCGVSPCEEDAVYRVPWHSVGGDIPYCSYHLARFRARHPDLWDRIQDVVDEDLTALATRGDRFVTFDDVPQKLFDEEFRAIALLANGHALYEESDPDDIVTYVTVDRSVEVQSRAKASRSRAGSLLRDLEGRIGVHQWDDDVQAALYGGEEP